MYSLAQKRMMAKVAGETEVVLTTEEVEHLHEGQDELLATIKKYLVYVPIEKVLDRFNNEVWQGSYKRLDASKNEAGGCTITMQEAENILAENSALDKLIVDYTEYVPEDVLKAETEEMFGDRDEWSSDE